jgi:hypothetical protein
MHAPEMTHLDGHRFLPRRGKGLLGGGRPGAPLRRRRHAGLSLGSRRG